MKKLIEYQKNLINEIKSIQTVANISGTEYLNAYNINNEIINDLINCPDKKLYKKIIKFHIDTINFSKMDTEYREFILSSLEKTASVIDKNISFLLNSKLYGWPLAFLIRVFRK